MRPSNGNGSSAAHGSARFAEGFDLVEVVAEYNALREVLFDFAEKEGPFGRRISRIINRAIDHAVAFAVKAHATERTCELQRRRREYVAFLVHDLKTPLSAMQLASCLVDARNPDQQGISAKYLAVIRRNTDRLSRLINDLLSEDAPLQSDTTSLEKREFDVWPAVEALIRDLRPLADKQDTTILNEIPEELALFADAHALCRVFQNLLSNAIKHTKSGCIVVGARVLEERVQFWVRDSGEGIAADQIAIVFTKHETSDARDGSGLGLAIVGDIVEAHGGEVTVESIEGRGSTFTFTIP